MPPSMTPTSTSPPALGLYRCQQEIRQLENAVSTISSSRTSSRAPATSRPGMEAIAAAFGVALRTDDSTFGTYRGHAHALARGVPDRADDGRAARSRHRSARRQGRLDAPHQRRARDDGLYAIVGAHLPIATGRQSPGSAARTTSPCASSATAPRTSAPSTRRSTSPPSGSCRSSSCARTTSTGVHGDLRRHRRAPPRRRPGGGLRHRADRRRRQRRRRHVRRGAGPPSGGPGRAAGRR